MTPRLSAIVCTRDRPESCAQAVASVLAARTPECEVIVVDQSRDGRTQAALAGVAGAEGAITYLRSTKQGVSAARNEGARIAAGELLLFTDDDCTVEADWVTSWCRVFADPVDGIAFGRVSSPPFTLKDAYVPEFEPLVGSHGLELFRVGPCVGIGANMALRRQVLLLVGGFDESLGPGAPFPAAEELDLAYRIVRAGHRILHVSTPRVWHHGYRSGASASKLVCGYLAAVAATYTKHMRCGDPFMARLLFVQAGRHATDVASRALRGVRPLGLRSLLAYVRAVPSSWARPLDTHRHLYRPERHGEAA